MKHLLHAVMGCLISLILLSGSAGADDCTKKLDGVWKVSGGPELKFADRETGFTFDMGKQTFRLVFDEEFTGTLVVEKCEATEIRLILTAKDEPEKAIMVITFTDNDHVSATMKGENEKNDGESIQLVRKK